MPETLHIRQGECVFLHRNHTVGIIKLLGQNGTQIGDPAKVAKLYIQLAVMENPPVNMPMGSDSVDGIRQICANTVKAMDEIRPLAATTDY